MTLWEMFAREPPFKCLSPEESERMQDARVVWRPPMNRIESAPTDVRLLIARCLQVDPSARPSVPACIVLLNQVLKQQLEMPHEPPLPLTSPRSSQVLSASPSAAPTLLVNAKTVNSDDGGKRVSPRVLDTLSPNK